MLFKLIRLIRRCIDLAIPFGKKRLILVAGVIFLNGIFELIGVASVLPFFALATNPDEFLAKPFAQKILEAVPFIADNPIMWAGIASIILLFV